jgi:hypothetical protein
VLFGMQSCCVPTRTVSRKSCECSSRNQSHSAFFLLWLVATWALGIASESLIAWKRDGVPLSLQSTCAHLHRHVRWTIIPPMARRLRSPHSVGEVWEHANNAQHVLPHRVVTKTLPRSKVKSTFNTQEQRTIANVVTGKPQALHHTGTTPYETEQWSWYKLVERLDCWGPAKQHAPPHVHIRKEFVTEKYNSHKNAPLDRILPCHSLLTTVAHTSTTFLLLFYPREESAHGSMDVCALPCDSASYR